MPCHQSYLFCSETNSRVKDLFFTRFSILITALLFKHHALIPRTVSSLSNSHFTQFPRK